jgi:hypothetical protein
MQGDTKSIVKAGFVFLALTGSMASYSSAQGKMALGAEREGALDSRSDKGRDTSGDICPLDCRAPPPLLM